MRPIDGCARLVVIAASLLAACDGDDMVDPSSLVETVVVIPGVVSLTIGDTLRLTTIARGDIGNPLTGRPVVWGTSSASVVTVSEAGLVTGVAAGAATITATIEGKVGVASVTVSPSFPDAIFSAVTAGGAHTCGLTVSGQTNCWGRGESGQLGVAPPVTTCLGDQAFPCGLVPFPLAGAPAFVQLSAGGAHTCGLTSDGSAWCWGNNTNGQLGDGTLTARHTPMAVATSVKFASISAGFDHTCALSTDGAGWCWGANSRGQLGDSTTVRRSLPVAVRGMSGISLAQISAGGAEFRTFTCGLSSTNTAYCWGANDRGQLGRGARDFTAHPLPGLVSGDVTFSTLVVGLGNHVCGLSTAGTAYCWGGNGNGALGDGTSIDSFLPLAVPGGLVFSQLTAGGYAEAGHTCGLTNTGAAYCWGDNDIGAVGDGTMGGRRIPVAVAGNHRFTSLSAGHRHTCGRRVDGLLFCWGSGRTGQLGTTSTASSATPLKVAGQP
jgi:alpha-tubulin suppressor-like RCC1 family protein